MERPIKDSICYRNTSLKRGMKRTAKSSTCNNTVNLEIYRHLHQNSTYFVHLVHNIESSLYYLVPEHHLSRNTLVAKCGQLIALLQDGGSNPLKAGILEVIASLVAGLSPGI